MNCHQCGKPLTQKRFASGVLESPSVLKRRKYCNRDCMAKAMLKEKCKSLSHSRMKAHKLILKNCEICGGQGRLHVHHKDLQCTNNKKSNLMTLCPSCHRRIHSPNYTETGQQKVPCLFCTKDSYKKQMCNTHLSRRWRYGHPLAKKRKIGSQWVLMYEYGGEWFSSPLKINLPREWDDCADTAMP